MPTTFIANFIGTASPATIKSLSATTHENDGKWLSSKVNFIDQQVAGVIKIEAPQANVDAIKKAFTGTDNLVCQFTDCDASLHDKGKMFSVRFNSSDKAGIVNEITQVLDAQGISILDMDCHRVFVAGAGNGVSASLFTAELALKLPASVTIDDVTRELESLSDDTRVVIED
ncbi:transcriptional regulator [Vibrio sp. UCD-FRSSP16_10]|uniref:glycine cleavage system protein R n=1 Tax=unclassified Vibrio TaxID=2614977 RepID=UPI0007FF9AAB|nr:MULTISPECIES: ACT domain-containing protein [unclassified Vibrio]OBT12092.1 transcriptional regulator [Vibrio sp. UCD-FRSSP16_30]OBT20423.1 transcriptional regulator [Vibrio sp. UCD-FRSSP16_10]